MSPHTPLDYYLAPQSPWAYLGHERLVALARKHGLAVTVRPMDLGGQVFPVSGGLPLGQRAPQRQAYRLVELRRFADVLGLPLVLKPRFFPYAGDPVSKLIVRVQQADGVDAALALTGAVLRACWAEERNMADPTEHAALLASLGLPAQRLAEAEAPEVAATYQAHTARAIAAGVFGAPSYVLPADADGAGELFWGQDRLDLLDHRLTHPSSTGA